MFRGIRTIALLIALVLCVVSLPLGALADTDYTGVWTLDRISTNGQTYPVSLLGNEFSFVITLNADKTATAVTFQNGSKKTINATWRQFGNVVYVSDITLTDRNGTMEWTSNDITYYFVRRNSIGTTTTTTTTGRSSGSSILNKPQRGANGVTFTLLGVRQTTGTKGWNTAPAGTVYLEFNFKVDNNSGEQYYVNTMFNFTATCNGTELESMNLNAFSEQEGKLADYIENGRSNTGEVGYPVPSNWQEVTIRIKPSYFGSDELVFTVHPSDLSY